MVIGICWAKYKKTRHDARVGVGLAKLGSRARVATHSYGKHNNTNEPRNNDKSQGFAYSRWRNGQSAPQNRGKRKGAYADF